MKPKILKAEYDGEPTYLIVLEDENGTPFKALKWIMDGKAVWTDRLELAWHNPSQKIVSEALRVNFDIEYHRYDNL